MIIPRCADRKGGERLLIHDLQIGVALRVRQGIGDVILQEILQARLLHFGQKNGAVLAKRRARLWP